MRHPDVATAFTVWDEKTSARVFNEVRSAPYTFRIPSAMLTSDFGLESDSSPHCYHCPQHRRAWSALSRPPCHHCLLILPGTDFRLSAVAHVQARDPLIPTALHRIIINVAGGAHRLRAGLGGAPGQGGVVRNSGGPTPQMERPRAPPPGAGRHTPPPAAPALRAVLPAHEALPGESLLVPKHTLWPLCVSR